MHTCLSGTANMTAVDTCATASSGEGALASQSSCRMGLAAVPRESPM